MKRNGNRKPCLGWGVNDVDYVIGKSEFVNGKYKTTWTCPYYTKWYDMLRRVYSKRDLERYPSYKGCTIEEEWKYLTNFIKWVDTQPNKDWLNCHLDKDLLVLGNKHYSSETCVFIPPKLNTFLTDSAGIRGEFPVGVHKDKRRCAKPFEALCNNPFSGEREYLGRYSSAIEAHNAWKNRKHELCAIWATHLEDERVIRAILSRYSPESCWLDR